MARRRGLTLVEVIIVLLIVEVALFISVQTFVQGIDIERRTADRTRAALVAQTLMDALLRDATAQGVRLDGEGTFPATPQPVNAGAFGLEPDAGEGFRWQASVAPHGDYRQLREIELTLTWTAAGRSKHIELVSLAAVQP